MENAVETYNQLVREIERELRRLEDFYGDILQCRPACDDCCIPFSLLPLEAAIIRQAYETLDDKDKFAVMQRIDTQHDKCPLLIQRKCSIYQSRPLICRTHGLPITYISEELETIEVSACPVNFPDGTSFERDGLLFMDPFNEKLAAINHKFVNEKGMRHDIRVAMHKIISGANTEIIHTKA